ncbi:MAG: isoprenylcysteine carboxylmethyltransferase family protein [Planctomycetes bacterium]|nr:isoprenylcysteine carboxylmethyltransferase family protein [Planctomycetota bacterium]
MTREIFQPGSAGVSIPPPLFYAGALAAAYIAEVTWPWPIWPDVWARFGRAVGWGLVIWGSVIDGWAALTLLRARTPILPNRTARALVARGPFRLSRNPIYLALFGISLGIASLWNTWWAVIVLPGVWLVLDLWIIRREEQHLATMFPDDYDRYRSRVRRWLGRRRAETAIDR